MKGFRILLLVCSAMLLAAIFSAPSLAQCAMCSASVQNSTDAQAASRTLDLAAMILLIPPVTIFAGLFGVFYRFRNFQGGRAVSTSTDEPAFSEEQPPEL